MRASSRAETWMGPGRPGVGVGRGGKTGPLRAGQDMGARVARQLLKPLCSPQGRRVVNLENGRTHVSVVMDRGPFTRRLIADVSPALADRLGMNRSGPSRIRLTMATSGQR